MLTTKDSEENTNTHRSGGKGLDLKRSGNKTKNTKIQDKDENEDPQQ
jgi:hypothetical protein